MCDLISSAHVFYFWNTWIFNYIYNKTVYVEMME